MDSAPTLFEMDPVSLAAARQWLEKEPTSSSSTSFKITAEAIVTAAYTEGEELHDGECRFDSEMEDTEDSMYINDGGGEGRANEVPPAVPNPLAVAPGQPVNWIDLGLLSRILMGMFLLTNSFSSYSYRFFLGVMSAIYYLIESGIASYFIRKLFRADFLPPNQQGGEVNNTSALLGLYNLVVHSSRTIPVHAGAMYDMLALISAFCLSIFPGWEP